MGTGRRFQVRARGELACFTRPEMKVERISYEVMTPSAARGVLEAILWKPGMTWRVWEIAVLSPIRWISFRRNEVATRAMPNKEDFCADEARAQRNTVALRNVDYLITASMELTNKAGPSDNLRKFEEMFERRVAKGQYHHTPYLGCREFDARVEAAPESVSPIDPGVDRPLGWMFFDFDWRDPANPRPLFFEARLEGGVVRVPSPADVLRDEGTASA